MRISSQVRNRPARIGRLTVLVSLALATGAFGTANATPDEHGPVTAIALDAQGNGWFATGDEDGYLTIQRLENGDPPWLTYGDPANKEKGITRMAMTAKGDDGWAVGFEGAGKKPLLWRLRGAWGPAPHNLASNVELTDVALADDGHDGWLVGRFRKVNKSVLMRLRNGGWTPAQVPVEGVLTRVGISADGGAGWGFGFRSNNSHTPLLFRLKNGRWSVASANPFPAGQMGKLVTVDDAGNGWLVAGRLGESKSSDTLIRLTREGKAKVVLITPPPTGFDPEPLLALSALDVNGQGIGWAVGSLLLYSGTGEYGEQITHYEVVPIRLRGEGAFTVPSEAAGLVHIPPSNENRPNIYPTTLTIGPDGAQTLLGGISGKYDNNGLLYHLHEPWPYLDPSPAPPMPGAGRCFDSTPYCLRGAFAQYWELHGGLERFGYPITPEVREKVRFRQGAYDTIETILVQYTERARLECRQWCDKPDKVTLGLLGREWETMLRSRSSSAQQDLTPFQPVRAERIQGKSWFSETQHFVGPPFLDFWLDNGGVRVYGYPISEPLDERGTGGKVRLVQYFERNRLEYHPESKSTRNEVTPGDIGMQTFRNKHGYTP